MVNLEAPEACIVSGLYNTEDAKEVVLEYIPLTRTTPEPLEPIQEKQEATPEIVATMIKNAKYPVVITGAGISTESMLQTRKQLWEQLNRIEYVSIWKYFEESRNLWNLVKKFLSEANYNPQPNRAHQVLAELEKEGKIKAIITQNVDNLHQAAGSKNVIEMHGTLSQVKCSNCDIVFNKTCAEFVKGSKSEIPPPCTEFGKEQCISHIPGSLRPNVVLFGELVPASIVKEALEHIKKSDLVLVVGTASDASPTCELPRLAKRNGAKVVEIKRNLSRISHIADVTQTGEAGPFLQEVLNKFKQLN